MPQKLDKTEEMERTKHTDNPKCWSMDASRRAWGNPPQHILVIWGPDPWNCLCAT